MIRRKLLADSLKISNTPEYGGRKVYDGDYHRDGSANGRPKWKGGPQDAMNLYFGPQGRWILRTTFEPDSPTCTALSERRQLILGENDFIWSPPARERRIARRRMAECRCARGWMDEKGYKHQLGECSFTPPAGAPTSTSQTASSGGENRRASAAPASWWWRWKKTI